MKIKVTLEIDYAPSAVSLKLFPELVDQFLSDYDLHVLVEDKVILKAEAVKLED